jgi:hypothetical protein
MSKRVPAGRSRSGKGRTASCAVAGAANIGWAESVPDCAGKPGLFVNAGRLAPGHARRAGQQRRRRRADDEWSVHAEFPVPVRIGPAELSALEAHLGAEIDAILASPSGVRSSDPCAPSPTAPEFQKMS